MPDLTDSFCERCGARYAFNPNAPKGLSLKGARVLAKGLKNFVLTDGQSMTDSLTLARHEDDHEDSTRATAAFHRTFNFCMTCRQYACDRCWNSKVGACLSCAPDSRVQPVAPEDHLIVRTPVARWDADWSLFPDGPAVEPLARPAPPLPFDEPIHLVEPSSSLPPRESSPAAWPQADLSAAVPTETRPNGKGGQRPVHKPIDPGAASLWPIADEISPEMTLTPEEMEIVETGLNQGENLPDAAPDEQAVPGSQPFDGPASWPPQHTFTDSPDRPAEWTATLEILSTPAAQAPQPPAAEAQVPPEQMPAMAVETPSLPPLENPTPSPRTRERPPIVARLLGLHAPETAVPASAKPSLPGERPAQPAGDLWPHATAWSNRAVEVHDRAETEVPVEEVASEPVAPASPAPTPSGRGPAEVDARSAAAVRLSAVTGGGRPPIPTGEPQPAPTEDFVWAAVAGQNDPSEPIPVESALQRPLFDESPAVPEARPSAAAAPPAWPEADQEIVAVRRKSADGPDRAQIRQPSAPAAAPQAPLEAATPSWPPFGSSWPAQENPMAPWPGPEGAPVSPVVAAQQTAAPTIAEMWAQSAQEVLNRGSVRVCHRCALPVSTQARFCRRCGTQQA